MGLRVGVACSGKREGQMLKQVVAKTSLLGSPSAPSPHSTGHRIRNGVTIRTG